jgi:ankyrin repeat protein
MVSIEQAKAASILINLGANTKAPDNSRRTPLYTAAQANHKDAFLMLYRKQANKNTVDNSTRRTLLY